MSVYSRANPFTATLIENRLLSAVGSAKEVRHFVFDLTGSGMEYRVGQSLGVCPCNSETDVLDLLEAAGLGGDEQVLLPKAKEPIALRDALTTEFYLGGPSRKFVEALAAAAKDPAEKAKLEELLAPPSADLLTAFLSERFFVDLFEEFPSSRGGVAAQTLVECLKRLQPRLYSISSSPKVGGSHVDLTVAIVRYQTNGRKRNGVCSTFMADRLPLNAKAGVFVGNSPFGLTDDDKAPVIMVGPGTGIAPFRAFLQERAARQATGRNWLFFGDQHAASDFLYQTEFASWQSSGLLTRLDLAWSRDQEKKIYVQDRMRENGAELWKWLEAGAYFYVCGDAKRMAKDVDAALGEIVRTHGGKDETAAAEYIGALKKAGRYLRDVY